MIPDEAVEAAHKAWREQAALDGSIFEYNLRAALEAAAPHLMGPILALCDEADTRRGSSMYCKLTTYEVRKAIGVKE